MNPSRKREILELSAVQIAYEKVMPTSLLSGFSATSTYQAGKKVHRSRTELRKIRDGE